MERDCSSIELLEDPSLPDELVAEAYDDLARVQRLLGNTAAVLKQLRKGDPFRSVLDIGCGHGALLNLIRQKFSVDVAGIDLRPAKNASLEIVTGNAVEDALPCADVAIAVCVAHHLSANDLHRMIRNVSNHCKRFIILDLVRHPLPLALFRIFVGPFLCRINAQDGLTSIRRAYTVHEMREIVNDAISGTGASVAHRVAPLYIRQLVDIRWP
jgi:SAM-dependent methyltransferase